MKQTIGLILLDSRISVHRYMVCFPFDLNLWFELVVGLPALHGVKGWVILGLGRCFSLDLAFLPLRSVALVSMMFVDVVVEVEHRS